MFLHKLFFSSLLGAALFALSIPAMAALGQVPSKLVGGPGPSLAVPGVKVLANAQNSTHADTGAVAYTVHETKFDNGTAVREFTTSGGVVFAVTWQGPVLPDLDALLGGYFKTFKQQTEQARAMGRIGSPVNMEHDGLVVRSNGRMRSFSGHAYVIDLIPSGVVIANVLE